MDYKTFYNKEKARIDELTDAAALWKRLEGQELTPEQIAFLQNCMDENLNHARHVDNERLTFNSILLALIAGALAFAGSMPSKVSLFLYIAITMAGFLSMLLTERWNNAFARHIYYAQQCYKLIHKNLFGDREKKPEENVESIAGLNDLPLYSFRIHSPIAYSPFGKFMYKWRTRTLYDAFYWMIQIFLIACTLTALVDVIRGM